MAQPEHSLPLLAFSAWERYKNADLNKNDMQILQTEVMNDILGVESRIQEHIITKA